jgi:hypothetical protein
VPAHTTAQMLRSATSGTQREVVREVIVVRGETTDELARSIADRMDINARDRMAMLGDVPIVA